MLNYAAHARALASLGRGDFEEAYQHAALISPAGTLTPHVGHALWVALDLVDAAVRANRPAQASAHVAAMQEAEIGVLSSRLALVVSGCAAMVASDQQAVELFELALATPDAEKWPFEHARIQLAYGERLRRARATTESRAVLTDALATFRRLGARPWELRTAHELRAAGGGRPKGSGPADAVLTPQEREIASLAAVGLTNKQIADRLQLSPRTVSAHLYRVFPKLGVTSRAALHDALAALPPQWSDEQPAD